jgi:anaerobic selenocysteine-containing dehydrogenase
MGYGEYFTWEDEDEVFTTLLGPTNITVDQLKENPDGIFYSPSEEHKYLKDGFNTPSGKVEIYSELMEKHGYDPLPTFREPAESPVSKPQLVGKYPLILTTGERVIAFTHSQHRNVPMLRGRVPQPSLEINTITAKRLAINDGDLVTVESPRGSIQLKAKVTEDIHPKVVSIPHGWAEANANILTDDEGRDPISAYPGFRSVLCRALKSGE